MPEHLYENTDHFPVLGGGVEIVRVSVTSADDETQSYQGEVDFIDYFEHGILGRHEWQAQPGPFRHTVFERVYELDITDRDPVWAPNRFTLASDVDRAMRHFILHGIVVVNPNLPSQPETDPYYKHPKF